jgi:hypothetical protein
MALTRRVTALIRNVQLASDTVGAGTSSTAALVLTAGMWRACPWRWWRSADTVKRQLPGVAIQGAESAVGVKSCDNASSGACEVRAAISHPRFGGSGLYALPRGHDQRRARGRRPRGAPVPPARLEG